MHFLGTADPHRSTRNGGQGVSRADSEFTVEVTQDHLGGEGEGGKSCY